jgi:hypothetical protein
MTENSKYPRVLVTALGRINAVDSSNNGLLLRNLFGNWPRENLAQIYSSGDSGDEGFFGHYYKLGLQDRRLGKLFYRLKKETLGEDAQTAQAQINAKAQAASSASWIKRLLVNTGLYEVIFAPRLSAEMRAWVDEFRPDIIFAQGYNLTFAWLPVMLKEATHAKMAFFCTDDWPTYLYAGLMGEPHYLRWLMGPIVRKSVARLLDATDVPLAFGQPMGEEYATRYSKPFKVLSHADDPRRFESAQPVRVHPAGTFTIMAVGNFNRFRWPLLLDANESCRLLNAQGIPARVALLSSAIAPEGASQLAKASFIDIFEDPGNDSLPCYLKGADVLLLAEGFDEGFVSAIRLSISSKAHLFMFSQRPIIVYAHPDTGIARYASARRWARVVPRRDSKMLTETIRDMLTHHDEVSSLIGRANETARTFHTYDANHKQLFSAIIDNAY